MAEFDMAAYVRESRERQGLPPTIQDDVTLDKLAALVVELLKQSTKDRPAQA
jgi:hypothetical protein